MKKWILAASLAAATPTAMAMPFVDLEFGGGLTFPNLNGGQIGEDVFLTTDGDENDGQVNLDLSADNGFYVAGRFGIPILPNVKFRYENLQVGNSNVTQTFEAFGEEFVAEGEVILDMSYLDTAFVYGIPNLMPGIDYYVDFGLNLRWLLGGIEAEVEGERQSESLPPVPLPSGHLAAGVTIPMVDVELSGELNTLPIDGLNYNDWNVKARWYAPLPTNIIARLGIEAGYRSWTVDIDGGESDLIDDEDVKLDFDTSGFFVGTVVKF